ncbi:MAG: hypothetical protein WC718_06195 [Phycisphaerales bacterium]|jgi:hypothetical protein
MIKRIAATVILACGVAAFAGGCASETKTSDANMGIVNRHCPIQPEDPVNPAVNTTWKGQKVGFCCPGCIDEWDRKTDDQKAAALEKAK